MDWEISKKKHNQVKNIISSTECQIVKGISTNKGFCCCVYNKGKIKWESSLLNRETGELKKSLIK